MEKEKNSAIVLSAGKGSRMNTEIQKQYLLLNGKPVICYALEAFEECPFIDEVILVAGGDEKSFCQTQIVDKYGFSKVSKIVEGGKERYHSVFEGLKAVGNCDYIYIHDGARPFVDQGILERAHDGVRLHEACAVGMPVKDTIKVSDDGGFVAHTPNRSSLWMIQTPQVFSYPLIYRAYEKILGRPDIQATDDAMAVETMEHKKVKLVRGSYRNIKITTPEDLEIAEVFCK